MNKITRLISSVLIMTGLLTGCRLSHDAMPSAKTAKVTLSVSNNNARTAKPSDVDFTGFYYQLVSSNSKAEIVNHFSSKKTYAQLASTSISLTLDTYSFTLAAYNTPDSELPVFTGSVTDVNLTTEGTKKNLAFVMKPATGSKGNASIKLEIINLDSPASVSRVKAGVATSPIATEADCDISLAGLQSIHGSGTDRYVTYSASGLDSGITQFVIFYIYDNNNNLIATIAESIIVVADMTSSSTITRDSYRAYTYPVTITLYKDGARWDARKVKLRDKNSSKVSEFELTKTGDDVNGYSFIGNVWTSQYEVWVQTAESNNYKNTYITVDTANGDNAKTLNFYTATLTPGTGVVFTATDRTPQSDGTILIQAGETFDFTTELKEGYNLSGVTGSKITVKNNGTALANALTTIGSTVNNSISNVNGTLSITSNSAHAIPYSITYDISASVDNGISNVYPSWVGGSLPSKFSSYTVTNDFDLPTAADISCTGMIIDGWYVESEGESAAFSTIKADTRHQNLTLLPKWKKAEASSGASSDGESSDGTLSSNGISFIIKEESGETHIYYDLDSDGVLDSEDTQVIIDGRTDFSNYEITAESLSGDIAIASNVKFTMTGGTIYSIKGLGKDAANTSTLNVYGNSIIGGVTGTSTTKDSEGNDKTYSTTVHGVVLSTFTNEIIHITGTITSNQNSIYLLTDYEYDSDNHHYIATMPDTSYAEGGIFNCYASEPDAEGYALRKTGKIPNGDEYVIRLVNEASIILPDTDPTQDDGIIIVKDSTDESVTIGFTFGADKINTQCSVMSISTQSGSFKFLQSKIYPNDSSKETGLNYLGQYKSPVGGNKYTTTLDTTNNFVYMHVMASNNQFTEGDASDFISQILFVPDTDDAGNFVEMNVKVNLETVPWEKIAEMKAQAKSNTGSEDAFSYFDGSFYLGVKLDSCIKWSKAYSEAKKRSFNGLKGYLMNITSDLENSYITNRMSVGDTWIGGARILPGSGYDTHVTSYDMDEIADLDDQTYVTGYYWIAGPEAGTKFTDGNIPSNFNDSLNYTGRGFYGYEGVKETVVTKNGTRNYSTTVKTTIGYGYDGTTTTTTKTSTSGTAGTTYASYGTRTVDNIGYTNWDANEPNDSCDGKSEQCVHFYGTNNGVWNDYADSYNSPKSYMIEFTPYTTQYGTSGTPDALPISKSAAFDISQYSNN